MDRVQEHACMMARSYLLKKKLGRELRRDKLVLWLLGMAMLTMYGVVMYLLGRGI